MRPQHLFDEPWVLLIVFDWLSHISKYLLIKVIKVIKVSAYLLPKRVKSGRYSDSTVGTTVEKRAFLHHGDVQDFFLSKLE